MTYLVSISKRNLVYFPAELVKRLKIKSPGKIKIEVRDDCLRVEPVKKLSDLAGSLKGKGKNVPDDFDYRKYMEENYDEVDRF